MLNNYFVVGNEEALIKLCKNLWTIIDFEDLELAKSIPLLWSAGRATETSYYYASARTKDGEYIRLHRLILRLDKFDGRDVDHKDRNGLNNKKNNLKAVSRAENNYNARMFKNNKSGTIGVFYLKNSNTWLAYITINKKRIHLGHFRDKEKAIEARSKAEDAYK